MKILLAIDDSSCSQTAVRSIAGRPWPKGSEVRIVTVIDPPLEPTPKTWNLPDNYLLKLEQSVREHLEALVQNATDVIREGKCGPIKVTHLISNGYASEVILDEANNWGADLIVIGSHGRHGFKRLWLGSVSYAVMTNAMCSVEIVKCFEEAS